MEINNKNTILITGGASGIGYEFAKQLCDTNTVIVVGRNKEKLEKIKKELQNIHIFECDVSNPNEIKALYEIISYEFPNLNILINNAGLMNKLNLQDNLSYEELTKEMNINFNGSVYMTTQFLSLLKKQKTSSIINITSALAYVPMSNSPIYCASKAALHSFTQSLRIQLKDTNIKVFEIAPSVTKTAMGDSFSEKNMKIITTKTVVDTAIKEIKKGKNEIGVGQTNALKILNRIFPSFALKLINKA